MKKFMVIIFTGIVLFSTVTWSQPKRTDAIWARTAPAGSITVDGVMNEPAWAAAESLVVQYGKSAGLPGSGYAAETGVVLDSVKAVVKFLVIGDSLYLAFTVKDSSIGGGIFGAADAIIFNIRDKSDNLIRPAPSGEYLWGWINESWMDPGDVTSVGAMPKIGPTGRYQKSEFETATKVKGTTNIDGTNNNAITDPTKIDTSYTVEMKINLKARGYKVTDPNGDIVMFNAAIRDCDWAWPFQDFVTFSRTWIQGAWANVSEKNFLRIHVRPDVTINSGPLPSIAPDYTLQNGKNFGTPVIDGKLDEAVWGMIPGLKIRFGDTKIRDAYTGAGPFASGQFQPDVNGGKASVFDSSLAVVKMFFKGNMLYIGVDVQDMVVQFYDAEDRFDGMMFSINGLGKDHQNPSDHDQIARKLTVIVGQDGKENVRDYLKILRDSLGGAQVALKLKPNTTVDTIDSNVDEGYQIEIAIDLTKLGYPSGLGDGVLYLGMTLYDGDSFVPASLSYGTRTWWFREREGNAAAAFVYMDPNNIITSVPDDQQTSTPSDFKLIGNYPNPFNPSTTIRFSMPVRGFVDLAVYDLLGRTMQSIRIGERSAGEQSYSFNASGLSTGVYFYRLFSKNNDGRESVTPISKMVLVK